MRSLILIALFLLICSVNSLAKSGDCGNGAESCRDNEDLSFLETILLFPLSFTEKPISLPIVKDARQPESVLSSAYHLTTSTCSRWFYAVSSYMRLLTEYGWSLVGWLLDSIQSPMYALYNCLGAFPESMLYLTMHGYWQAIGDWVVIHMSGLCERPSCWDFLRYLVVMVLAVSILPAVKLTEKKVGPKRSQKDKYSQTNKEAKTFYTKLSKPLRILSPLLEVSRKSSLISQTRQRIKSPFFQQMSLYHYPMCEYFDFKLCNCGGKPSHEVFSENKSRLICLQHGRSSRKQVYSYHPKIQTRTSHQEKSRESRSDTRLELRRECAILDANRAIEYTDKIEHCTELYKQSNKTANRATPSDDINDAEEDVSDVFEMSINDIDIGEPCFNSSFKEESMFVIKDAIDPHANGDGPDKAFRPAIMTRRSPVKQLGLSFDECEDDDEEEGPSYLDISFEETRNSSMCDDEGDSLLDVSYASTSISYSGTDGVLELAVVFVAQTMYRWAKGFLRHRKCIRRENNLGRKKIKKDGHFCNTSKNAVDNSQPSAEQHSNTGSMYFEPLNESFEVVAESDITQNEDDSLQISDNIWLDSNNEYYNDSNKENLPFVYDNEDSREIVHYTKDTSDITHDADKEIDDPIDNPIQKHTEDVDVEENAIIIDLQYNGVDSIDNSSDNPTEKIDCANNVDVHEHDIVTNSALNQDEKQVQNEEHITNIDVPADGTNNDLVEADEDSEIFFNVRKPNVIDEADVETNDGDSTREQYDELDRNRGI